MLSSPIRCMAVASSPVAASVSREAGFYPEWKKKFGSDAWAKLEQYTGDIA